MVSTIASGRAPMAARSLTLASTAAMPAPKGSAATNGGHRASPPTTMVTSPSVTTAPSSPGPAKESTAPKTSETTAMGALLRTPGWERTMATNSARVSVISAAMGFPTKVTRRLL